MKPAVHKQPKGEPGNPVSNDMQLYRLSGTLKVIIKFHFLSLLIHELSFKLIEWSSERDVRLPSDGCVPDFDQYASGSSARLCRNGQRSRASSTTSSGLFGSTSIPSTNSSNARRWTICIFSAQYNQLPTRSDERILAAQPPSRRIRPRWKRSTMQNHPFAQSAPGIGTIRIGGVGTSQCPLPLRHR